MDTIRHTDRMTDGQSDSIIPPCIYKEVGMGQGAGGGGGGGAGG